MKTILLAMIASIYCAVTLAQTGATCNDAIPEFMISVPCTTTPYSTTTNDTWFSFVATGTDAQITVLGAAFGDFGVSHIHNISLFEGVCSNLLLIAGDELPFINIAEELTIDASGLVVGNTYYLRVQREASAAACPTCVGTGLPSASFSLCIQQIDVFQPLDFELANLGIQEVPNVGNAYYTNKGQIIDENGNLRPDILAYTANTYPQVMITANNLYYQFTNRNTSALDTFLRVGMELVGANQVGIFKTEKIEGNVSYYLAHIPSGITNLSGYSRLVCNNIYPNIDLQYYSNSEGLKMYFIVHPGGNADDIVMSFTGGTSVDVTGSGGLKVSTPLGSVDYEAGHAYQINNGGNVVPMIWQAKFEKTGTLNQNQVKLDIRNYAHNMPLIIQIDKGGHTLTGQTQQAFENIEWSSLYRGFWYDFSHSVTTDANGDIFMAGESDDHWTGLSTQLIVTNNNSNNALGSRNGFIVKFREESGLPGVRKWAIFYAGTGDESFNDVVALAPSTSIPNGAVIVTGTTNSTDLPIPPIPINASAYHQIDNAGGDDALVIWFDNSNNTQTPFRQHASYIGGVGDEQGLSIGMDENDNVYITGRTTSTDASNDIVFPCDAPTNGGLPQCDDGGYYQATNNGGIDGFLLKFTGLPTSMSLRYGSYFGGEGDDEITNIKALGTNEQFYIIGNTTSQTNSDQLSTCGVPTNNGFPLCDDGAGYFQQTQTSTNHDYAFISKFKVSGGSVGLAWSSVFGGGTDKSYGLDIDAGGNIYMVGSTAISTLSANNCGVPALGEFPVCDPGNVFYQSSYGGGLTDAYIAKFDASHQFVWGSLMGGDAQDEAYSIAISDGGYSYITGVTWSASGFPLMNRANTYYQDLLTSRGPYLLSFDPTHNQGWGTYFNATFGGSTTDTRGAEVAVFQDSKLFLTGTSHVIGLFDDAWGNDHDWPIKCSPTLGHWCGKKGSPTDGFIAQFDLTPVTGIDDMEYNTLLDDILVYPNPTDGNINIKFKLSGKADVSIKVYNVLGKLVYDNLFRNEASAFNQEFSFASYSKGMYLMNVLVDGRSYSKKILFQ